MEYVNVDFFFFVDILDSNIQDSVALHWTGNNIVLLNVSIMYSVKDNQHGQILELAELCLDCQLPEIRSKRPKLKLS